MEWNLKAFITIGVLTSSCFVIAYSIYKDYCAKSKKTGCTEDKFVKKTECTEDKFMKKTIIRNNEIREKVRSTLMVASMIFMCEIISTITEVKEFICSHDFLPQSKMSCAMRLVQMNFLGGKGLSASDRNMIAEAFRELRRDGFENFSIDLLADVLSRLEAENKDNEKSPFGKFNTTICTETQTACSYAPG
ncbi:hypothetical protein ENBRE01_1650 [Enteropsectra breve]|nr:hypothetical protein ENBRE01_0419 [Enteropsectra breve]KAI5150152.1 hypothetical protein ENBRE01_1330 [Enteropsectra breve]KAI5150692.1 hypothetical protein ENBRE01_1650 [Enteropsectra breve]